MTTEPASDPQRRPQVGFHVSAFGSSHVLAALSALSEHGFEGLEIYADTTHIFADRPDEFRTILGITGIRLAGVHGGGMLTSEEFRDAEVAEWTRLVRWVADVGGDYAIFYGGESQVDAATDLRRAASFLNEVGRAAAGAGVKLCYEPDRTSPFGTIERVAALMEWTEPGWVWLSADTAHLAHMGVDPAMFLVTQRQRVAVVHVRDAARREPAAAKAASEHGDPTPERVYVEPGQGTLDLEGVADALRAVAFGGWVVGVVDGPVNAAHECAAKTAAYFREFLRLEF